MNKTLITLIYVAAMVALSSAAIAQDEEVDYGDINSWLCHPDNTIDLCDQDLSATVINPDGSLTIEPWEAHENAPIDCFYVYPTTSQDQGKFSDLNAARDEEIITAFTQAAHFKSQCRLFAPIYRQITIQALMSSFGDLAGNDQINYLDVVDAFNYYLQNYNNGRGFVLIGHSQGTSVLIELMRNEIDGKPVQQQLVSAILAGNPVIVPKGEDVGGTFQSIPLCRANDQTGCAINFMTYRNTIPPPQASAIFARAPSADTQAGCTNPANLAGGSGELDAYLSNIGEIAQAVAPMPAWTNPPQEITTRFVKVPGLLTARCVNNETFNYLEMTVNADPNDARTDDIRGDLYMGSQISADWGLHLIDLTITQGNLVEIVGQQARAYANK